MKERENFREKTDKGGVNCQWLWLVDLNYNFECDWLIKLSDKNLASEYMDSRSLLNQSQSKKL